jgi:CHAD domain-containing protein
MEFLLKHDETIATGIQRIICEQINYAVTLLEDTSNDRDIAVHESRKTLKKIRSVLRLVRDTIGAEMYQQENIFYRDIGRSLAPLRDSFVLIEVLDKIRLKTADKAVRQSATIVRRVLAKQHRVVRKSMLAGDTIPTAIRQLEMGREHLSDWKLIHNDFSALAGGLKRTYKRGRRNMAIAYKHDHSAELFHDWRKRVKDLWYQMLVLSAIWPAVLPALAEQMHKLSEILGDAHDLAVLREAIVQMPEIKSEETQALLKLIDDEQAMLEQSAQALGKLIYGERVAAFTERIALYWAIWQQSDDGLTLYMPDTQPI